ncbi:MAG: hypothetical protein FVQ84_08270 [Planctomycetes bacterium]|nr:hypothetical protein [Planctomycetota bacterium]
MRRLYKHQIKAFKYTLNVKHPALFMEMRLGKTLVTIRRCNLYVPLNKKIGHKFLVVAPNSALGSWEDDLKLESESKVKVSTGTRNERLKELSEDFKWFLLNKEGHLSIPEIARIKWDAVIIDESTIIKNPKPLITKFFLKNFRAVPHRWILTGLPNPESDLEYYCQFFFLYGSAFGFRNFWDFRAKCYEPDKVGYDWSPKSGVYDQVSGWVGSRAFIMSRKNAGFNKKKIFQKRYLDFPNDLREKYNLAEKDFELEGIQTMWQTVKYVWLRKLCGGFIEDRLVWDGKIKAVLELLKGELKKSQVVIWFNFTYEILAVEEALRKLKISCTTIFGKIKDRKEREIRRRMFQSGKIRIILLQCEIAKMGMDLSAADTAIYYSEPVGAETRRQTEDRTLSMQKDGPLLFINFIVKNSVDSDINQSHISKKFNSNWSLGKALMSKLKERVHAKVGVI